MRVCTPRGINVGGKARCYEGPHFTNNPEIPHQVICSSFCLREKEQYCYKVDIPAKFFQIFTDGIVGREKGGAASLL